MNENQSQRDPNSYDSLIGLPLPGSADSSTLPTEIQWMPPGRHNISASRGGKPIKLSVIVDATSASKVADSFASMMEVANRGDSDQPYFDFNHDDREASAWPKAFTWSGDDPRTGGIRAKVEWSGSGRRAVIGRDYLRFSPTFLVDGDGRVTGAPVNMGGLVNRAAFQTIQPVMGKSAEFQALINDEQDFLSKAKVIAASRNLEVMDAFTVLAREQPWSYDEYRAKFFGGESPRTKRPAHSAAAPQCDEFLIRARSLADAGSIDLFQAIDRLAHEQPALYARYRAKMGLGGRNELQESVVSAQASAPSPFFARAKAVASERGVDISDAFTIVARENPSLYDEYREAMY